MSQGGRELQQQRGGIEFNPADLKLDLAPPPPPSSLGVGEARLSSRVCAALLKAPADELKRSDPCGAAA